MNFALLLVVFAVVADEAPASAEGTAKPAVEVPPGTTDAAPSAATTTPTATTAPTVTTAPTAAASPQTATTEAPTAQAPAMEKKGVNFGEDGASSLSGTIALRMAQSVGNPLQLDETGTSTQPTPFDLRLRFGLDLKLDRFAVVSEFDVATGAVFGTPDATVVAPRIPTPAFQPAALRALYLQYKWETGAARLGVQTNQFGLGMLSNSGSRDAEPGDFGQQFGGVVVARAGFAARPFFRLGGAWRAVEPVAAFDFVLNDSTVNAFAGDVAFQGIWGLRFNVDEQRQLAITGVYRSARRPAGAPGERATDVLVGDLFGKWRVFDSGDTSLTLAAELAAIWGTTTQSRSDVAEVLDVRQFGAVAKVNFKVGRFGVLLDGGFASGDQNPYDSTLGNFRFDPNYKVGLVLFDQVLGYQSARSAWRAADPALAGVAPEGVDLLPTAGAITGAWFLFPRARFSAADWIDLYGGPLFAFASAALVDPFNTRLNGGTPVNALGARPGSYLGTELDLGVSVHGNPTKYLHVTATLEGGVLLPGDAFRTATGATMGPAGLGRLRLSVAL